MCKVVILLLKKGICYKIVNVYICYDVGWGDYGEKIEENKEVWRLVWNWSCECVVLGWSVFLVWLFDLVLEVLINCEICVLIFILWEIEFLMF